MRLIKTLLINLILVMMALPAFSGEHSVFASQSSPKQVLLAKRATTPSPGDKDLLSKHAEFSRFLEQKVEELNRNHRLSRSRMEITRQADGTWRALYHEIDGKSLAAKVRRSQSPAIPYVGILSYQEKVFEAHGKTPDQFDPEAFNLVKIIPNRHIFSYKQGSWN